ncbi:MAG: type II toxin-antitoxin system VapC family toxin [Acidobacteriota bacterium]
MSPKGDAPSDGTGAAPRGRRRGPRGGEVRENPLAYALDASAILALLRREPGSDFVASVLDVSVLSAVNWAEVLSKSLEYGADLRDAMRYFESLGVVVIPFSELDATGVAELRLTTKALGLSLGDRACLALAQRFEISALTADRAWSRLDLGIPVQQIRGQDDDLESAC